MHARRSSPQDHAGRHSAQVRLLPHGGHAGRRARQGPPPRHAGSLVSALPLRSPTPDRACRLHRGFTAAGASGTPPACRSVRVCVRVCWALRMSHHTRTPRSNTRSGATRSQRRRQSSSYPARCVCARRPRCDLGDPAEQPTHASARRNLAWERSSRPTQRPWRSSLRYAASELLRC
jgi:hypothetical protein